MKIQIVGVGAIGGIAGAWMAKAGEDVTFVDANPHHECIFREGFPCGSRCSLLLRFDLRSG